MVTVHARTDVAPLSPALLGRDEMNLAEFPHDFLADRVPKGQKTLFFAAPRGGVTITASDAYGLPTASDADVLLALIFLTKVRNNFQDVKVNFSRYELIRLLNWSDEGGSYKRLDESFNRWIGVSLFYDGCWWNNRLKVHTDAKMHIIETVEILDNDARRKAHLAGQSGLPLSYFIWNRTFIESCQADNLRQLDLETYFALKSAVSKRLDRFLGKRFYLQPDCMFDLKEIAFERVGLSRSYERNAAKIREKLQPAVEELEAIGFLMPLSREERYIRIDRGEWKIRLARHSPPAPTVISPQSITQVKEVTPPLVIALTERRITDKTAAELVAKHSVESIHRKIEVFDWLVGKQDKRVARSPEGYLVKSITDDYKTPKGFVSAAERRKNEEAKQAREQAAAEKRRQDYEAEAQETRERIEATAYWSALTPQQQAELQALVDSQADPALLALERGPLKRMGQHIRREAYIRQLLKERKAALFDA